MNAELMAAMKKMIAETVAQAVNDAHKQYEPDLPKNQDGDEYDGNTDCYYAGEKSDAVAADEEGGDEEAVGQDEAYLNIQGLLKKGQKRKREEEEKCVDSPDTVLSNYKSKMEKVEETSGKINQDLADVAADMVLTGLSEERVKALRACYLSVENCATVCPVRVNKFIYNIISGATREADCVLQKTQAVQATGLIALLKAIDEVKEAARDKPSLNGTFQKMTDAFSLLSHVNMDLNLRRRAVMKGGLNQDYRHICAASNPITSELFGDNVEDLIKQQTEANKVKQQVAAPSGRGGYGRGRGYNSGTAGGGGGFIQRGGGVTRGRGAYHVYTAPAQDF